MVSGALKYQGPEVVLEGSTSGFESVKANALAGSNFWIWMADPGDPGDLLVSDGVGGLDFSSSVPGDKTFTGKLTHSPVAEVNTNPISNHYIRPSYTGVTGFEFAPGIQLYNENIWDLSAPVHFVGSATPGAGSLFGTTGHKFVAPHYIFDNTGQQSILIPINVCIEGDPVVEPGANGSTAVFPLSLLVNLGGNAMFTGNVYAGDIFAPVKTKIIDSVGNLVQELNQTVTATVDGLTTGLIPENARNVEIASTVNTKFSTLPVPVPNHEVYLTCTANGYKLKSNDDVTVKINNVAGAGKALAVTAGDLLHAKCFDATNWYVTKIDNLGVPATAGVPA